MAEPDPCIVQTRRAPWFWDDRGADVLAVGSGVVGVALVVARGSGELAPGACPAVEEAEHPAVNSTALSSTALRRIN